MPRRADDEDEEEEELEDEDEQDEEDEEEEEEEEEEEDSDNDEEDEYADLLSSDDEALSESEHNVTLQIEESSIKVFEKAEEQLEAFFDEFSILSKKKPDGAINVFKVTLLNHTLTNANSLLGTEFRPFPGFEQFESDMLPTASDIVMILAQYLRSMNAFRCKHSYKTRGYGRPRRWNTGKRWPVIYAKASKEFTDK